jgi:hypothetical protein
MKVREIVGFAHVLSYIVNCNYLVTDCGNDKSRADLTGEPPNT